MKSLKLFLAAMVIFATVMLLSNTSEAQPSKQVIGSFPTMDGGFEGQIPGGLRNTPSFVDIIKTDWTVNTGPATIINTGARTGSQYVNYTYPTGSGGKPLWSPTADSQAIVIGVKYIVQYYYRTSGVTATNAVMTVLASTCGTSIGFTNKPTTPPALVGTNGSWQKQADTVTIIQATHLGYGVSGIRAGGPMGVAIDVDDFVMYASPTADITPPDPSTSPIATPLAGGAQMQLGWTAPVAGVDGGGYMIVRGTSDPATAPNVNGIYAVGNSVAAGEQVVYLGTNTTFTDAGLSVSTLYYYRIYTVDKAFNYSSSVNVNATTTVPVSPVPAAPQNLAVTDSSSKTITIKWRTNTEADFLRYRIYRGTSSAPTTKVDSTSGGISDTSKTFAGLTNGTRYYLRVTAVDSAGNESAYSNEVSATPKDIVAPGAPQNLVMTDTSDRTITIKWRKNTETDFLRYRIYRGISTAPTTKVDSTTGGITDTSKTFTGLTNGTRYYLRVTAVDSAGNESPYSNEVNGVPYINYWLGSNLITNGTFGSATGWTGPLTVGAYTANCVYDFNYSTTIPTGGTAPCLRMSLVAGSAVNSAYYQAVTLTSGKIYALDGLIKNSTSTSSNYWVEFYLSSVLPTNLGPDVVANGDTTVELAWLKQSAWGGVDNYDGKLSALASSRKDTIKKTGTYYFVIKTGTLAGGMVDAVLDNLTLNKLVFTPLAVPQNLVMTDTSDRTITIKWRKNTEANFLRYRIYRGTSAAPTTKVDSTTGGITDTSKTFTGLTNGTRYYLRITAVDSAGNESPYSNEVNGVPHSNYTLGPNLLTNGTFGSATGWTGPLTVGAYTANCTWDFNYSTAFPTGGTAPCLRISQVTGTAVNTAYYQAVTLTTGIYALDGLIKNSTTTSADYWVEFYLTSKLPTNLGPDVVAVKDTSVQLAGLHQSSWGGVDNYDGNLSALASSLKDTIKTAGTYYLVIKAGTLGTGKLDAIIDNLTLNHLIFTGVKNEPASVVKSFGLDQNYPNPFNPSTRFTYQMSKTEFVSLKVYDLVGREVATLVNEVKHAGNYSIEWNAAGMCSGIYFYKMQAGSFVATKKMILLK